MQCVVKGAMFLTGSGGTFTNESGEDVALANSEWFAKEVDDQGNSRGSTVKSCE